MKMTNKGYDKALEKKVVKHLIKMEKAAETYENLKVSFISLIESTPYEDRFESLKNNAKEMFI